MSIGNAPRAKEISIPSGFHPVRHDRLLQERVHDAYKSKGKLHEPSVCPQCGAAPAGVHQETRPACHRMHDQYPAGFLTLEGLFFQIHREEIMHLVHNHEQRDRAEHPLLRIMAVEEQDGEVLVTPTDIHLARGIGKAVRHAYQGELEFHYNPEENLLRVHWAH